MQSKSVIFFTAVLLAALMMFPVVSRADGFGGGGGGGPYSSDAESSRSQLGVLSKATALASWLLWSARP